MIIKGHSTIELRNITTGKVEKYENDNMVTNAIYMFFQEIGAFNPSPYYNSEVFNNLIPQLLGGLLLLDTPLQENANKIICPSGVKMVGNGSYNVSSGGQEGVTELGTWNATESGFTSDGKYMLVWDFSNTQANCAQGQSIACACLTSANHGFIGEGNTNSGAYKTRNSENRRSDYALSGIPNSISIDGMDGQGSRIVRVSRTAKTITMIDRYNLVRTTGHENEHMSETGKIKLVSHKMPLKSVDMRFGGGQQHIPVVETEVEFASAFKTALNHGNPYTWKKVGDTFFIAVGLANVDYGQGQFARWYANTPVQILRINADNTVSYFSVANPANSTIDINIDSFILAGNILFFQQNNAGTWFVDVTNQADVSYENLSVDAIDMVYPDEGVAQGDGIKIDIGARKVYYNNSWRNSTSRGSCYRFLSENPLTNSYCGNGLLYRTTNYLATINNLAEPVIKSAEKTMKVTYALTFIDGV